MKTAFTMIELIIVIVVLGILAGVALPRLMAPADDARLTKAKADISAIRSAISLLKNRNVLEGNMTNNGRPLLLDGAGTSIADAELFGGSGGQTLLTYPILATCSSTPGRWNKTAANTYSVNVSNTDVVFTYDPNTGRFECNSANGNAKDVCIKLLK